MSELVCGGCLCGEVTFTCLDEFARFYQCHCKQCQQLTGSAFASNLFTRPTNIDWLTGADSVRRFTHASRDFSKAFCAICGSALPFVNKTGKALVVPAGSLKNAPSIKLNANIFVDEMAKWHRDTSSVDSFDGFPE